MRAMRSSCLCVLNLSTPARLSLGQHTRTSMWNAAAARTNPACRWARQARLHYRALVAERADKQRQADAADLQSAHVREMAALRCGCAQWVLCTA
jgi:hypothetical protein